MNTKKIRPLALQWLDGDKATRTSIQQGLKGNQALQNLMEAVGDLLDERKSK